MSVSAQPAIQTHINATNAHSAFLPCQIQSSGIGEGGEELMAVLLVVIDRKVPAVRGGLADIRELLLAHPALRSARAVVLGKDLQAGVVALEIDVEVAPSRIVVNAHYHAECLSVR